MTWTPNLADLNPKKTLLFILKRLVYKDGHQFGLKDTLWEAIQEAAEAIPSSRITKLTASLNSRMIDFVQILINPTLKFLNNIFLQPFEN